MDASLPPGIRGPCQGDGVFNRAKCKGPKKLVTIPKITHYGVYGEAREQAQKLAVEWFDTHLKTPPKPGDGGEKGP